MVLKAHIIHISALGLCERNRGGMEVRGPSAKKLLALGYGNFRVFLAVLAISPYFSMYSEIEKALNYRILQYRLQGT